MDRTARQRLRLRFRKFLACARHVLPPGARLLAGLVLIVLGFFGFLPVIGFWMIPLGLAVAALDVKPLLRWVRKRRTSR